tara:strand:- start:25808 stop:28063 length:2256 start_codon:yes stop_codon:yes gene_type:complete
MSEWKKTACILCSENCGLEVQVEGRELVAIRGDKAHPESKGYICQKAARLSHYQSHRDRLDTPLAKQADGSFAPISWDEAIAGIAKRLLQIRDTHGGKTVAYYGGGGQGNHLGGVYASSLREAIGTPFVYTALAQEKTGDFWVNGKLFGRQTCHVTMDVEAAEFVVFLGTNPWQSHGFPRARKVLQALKADAKRTMIVIDPRRTETARMADVHLQLSPGSDAFLLGAMLAIMAGENLLDEEFIFRHCEGSEDVLAQLAQVPIATFIEKTGLESEAVHAVARGLAKATSASIRADLGIQQSLHSSLNSYLEKLLFLLTGNFGREGCNSFHSFLVPLIGHSPDADEDSSVVRTAVTKMAPISKLYPPNILPAEVLGEHPERLRALIVDSANPMVSAADTGAYRQAFARLDLVVVIDVAMTETAAQADYVLPASSQYEKAEATFFNLRFPGNAFHLRAPVVAPLPGTLPEPEIYRRICVAMGELPETFPLLEAAAKWGGKRGFGLALKAFFALRPKLIKYAPLVLYQTLGKTLPEGLQSAAILWASAAFYAKRHPEAVRRAGIDGADLGEALFAKLIGEKSGVHFSEHRYQDTFDFIRHPGAKIHLGIAELLQQLGELGDDTDIVSDEYPFVLMAGERRSYNANTIYRDPNWRKTDREGAMRMHPTDAERLGIAEGDRVKVLSRSGSIEAIVQHDDCILPGVLSLPHGYGLEYPEAGTRVATGPRINELTSADHCDAISKTPFHKTVPVRVAAL